jgi:hypothetical protein
MDPEMFLVSVDLRVVRPQNNGRYSQQLHLGPAESISLKNEAFWYRMSVNSLLLNWTQMNLNHECPGPTASCLPAWEAGMLW